VSNETAVFVSDAHFGLPIDALERDRRARFLRFLDSLHGVDRVIVAGDLFQFWFDLGSTIPKGYFDILEGLFRLRRSGTRIDYLGGNHDFWRSDFLQRELGIDTHADSLQLKTQGRHILVVHGDGVGPGDLGYKLLKRLLRNPATVAIARLLHPDALYALARRMDRMSHAHTSGRPLARQRLGAAAHDAFARGFDALVMGHLHTQLHEQLQGGELVVIGDWLELFSYVKLEAGVFHPGRWED
jgi:UDP-2,3-diacylglucosamine hydrolase